jgi:hypothetical protein
MELGLVLIAEYTWTAERCQLAPAAGAPPSRRAVPRPDAGRPQAFLPKAYSMFQPSQARAISGLV